MTSNKHYAALPPGAKNLFRKPPLIAGESADEYYTLVAEVKADTKPESFQEWLLTKDIVNAEWDMRRNRSMKVNTLHAAIPRTVTAELTEDGLDNLGSMRPDLRCHVAGMMNGSEEARKELEDLLTKSRLTLEVVMASTFERNVATQLKIDQMIGAARGRRNAGYAEFDRLRQKNLQSSTPAAAASETWPEDAAIDPKAAGKSDCIAEPASREASTGPH